MSIPVVVPSVGESVTEGRIGRWLVSDGASVKIDDTLLEIETEKATQPIVAQASGTLKIAVAEGEIVQIGQTVGTIDGSISPSPTVGERGSGGEGEKPTRSQSTETRPSPAAAAIIRDQNLDAKKITPTGPGGVITKDDALAAVKKPEPPKTAVATVPPVKAVARNTTVRETRQPMSMIRKRTAERLLESQNATATLTTFNEVDMSAVMELRAKYNERFEKRHGVKLGFMSIFVKAAVDALQAFPTVNARIDGNDVVYQHFHDISVAVSTDKGLFVPVIRDADHLGFAEIEKAISELAKKARDGKIGVADMQGGTFTITNGGIFGSMLSTPILNPPQTAILGMHSIQKRAMVVNDQIVIRPMMYLALSYDHRLIDGREAVQFLVRIKECIEDPERILFGV